MDLARLLERWRDDGVETRFLIGAADGLTRDRRMSADWSISFGKVTWPHMMVRAMLAEQLYRATSIIAGHPLSPQVRPCLPNNRYYRAPSHPQAS